VTVAARKREWLALALAAFVALVWLNQSVGLREWQARQKASDTNGVLDAVRAPFVFLYRRALDEEMYFATASAVLGRPYDEEIFAIRGDSPLPAPSVEPDGRLHVPYAEVPFEYPPPNLPFVVLPALLAHGFEGYARTFGAVMGVLLVLAAALSARTGRALGPGERASRLVAFSLLLLAHGALAIERLDAVVALLLVVVVARARRGDDLGLGFWSGIVLATKMVPVLACVSVAAAAGVFHERRRLGRATLGGLVGVVVGLGPMLLLAPSSLGTLLRYHGARGLHVESGLGVLYGAVRAVVANGSGPATVLDYGSFNFHGGVASALATGSTLLVLALVGLVAWRAATPRGEETREDRLVAAALGGVVAVWLGSKVFSPQYLTWALPLAVGLPRASWRKITVLLGAVLLVSQLYYRGYYDYVYQQRALGVVTMLVRLGLLVWLFRELGRLPRSAANLANEV
jgi:hypothetical protein